MANLRVFQGAVAIRTRRGRSTKWTPRRSQTKAIDGKDGRTGTPRKLQRARRVPNCRTTALPVPLDPPKQAAFAPRRAAPTPDEALPTRTRRGAAWRCFVGTWGMPSVAASFRHPRTRRGSHEHYSCKNKGKRTLRFFIAQFHEFLRYLRRLGAHRFEERGSGDRRGSFAAGECVEMIRYVGDSLRRKLARNF